MRSHSYSLISLLFDLILFLILSFSYGYVPNSQINALEELYASTAGASWTWQSSSLPQWDFINEPINPCSTNAMTWQGISCDNSPSYCLSSTNLCNIIEISLIQYNMTGPLPNLTNLTKLQQLVLDTNSLFGDIPTSLYQLTRLSLFENDFTKTIPPEIGQFTRLRSFDFSVNRLVGTLPPEIGYIPHLRSIYLDANSLHGSIPSSFQYLSVMSILIISGNSLSGQLPSFIGSLKSLGALLLSNNNMTGTIPSQIGSLNRLQILMLMNTGISGSLIPELWSLTNLILLELCSNPLTGTLPPSIASLSKLQILLLNTCFLEGAIPSSISQLSSLYLLDLEDNYFTSTIPQGMFVHLPLLNYITLSRNLLSNTLPEDISTLALLRTLTLEENYLTGSIPASITNLTALELFSLQDNFFSSSLPDGIGQLTSLTSLTLQRNMITSRLPSSVSALSQLVVLDISYNQFSSAFPMILSTLYLLQEFYLQDNYFTSTVSLSNPLSLKLRNLDMSDNFFSHTIPAELFLISTLQILSLTRNCFHGSLPSTICSSTSLVILSLDGLGAASYCPDTITIPWTTVALNSVMDGDVPPCIWSDLNQTLLISLSGNGLTGNIEHIPANSKLINISLSHNHLTGTIPSSLFSSSSKSSTIRSIDLSYNKFVGSLPPTFKSYQHPFRYLSLVVNRLSGDVPSSPLFLSSTFESLTGTSTMKILEGNLFSCATLPSYDPESSVYSCGAKVFTQSLYTLTTVGAAITLCMFLFWLSHQHQVSVEKSIWFGNRNPNIFTSKVFPSVYQKTLEYFHYNYPSHFNEFRTFDVVMMTLIYLFLSLLVIGLLCAVPLYILKSDSTNPTDNQHTTHSHVYEWIYTAAYTTGKLPAIILIVSWGVCNIYFVLFLQRQYFLQSMAEVPVEKFLHDSTLPSPTVSFNSLDIEMTTLQSISHSLGYRKIFKLWNISRSIRVFNGVCRVLLNIAVVSTVNAAYIISIRRDLTPTQHLLCEVAMALFSITWKAFFIPFLFSSSSISPVYSEYKTFASTLNSLFIPCATTALTSTSCYQVCSFFISFKFFHSHFLLNLIRSLSLIPKHTAQNMCIHLSPTLPRAIDTLLDSSKYGPLSHHLHTTIIVVQQY